MAVLEGNEQVINTLGHGAGVLIFAIFLYLVFQQRFAAGTRASRLSILAATLALLWNLASLFVLVVTPAGSFSGRIVAAVGFSVLSVLPAVLLQISLLDRFPLLVRAGYSLSILALAAHVAELFQHEVAFHRMGLAAITIGFGVLTAVAVLRVLWSEGDSSRSWTSRLLATMSLFLFAMSFVHFGEGHTYQAWSAELAVHHAGIPLALFVLLQEFRFVLLDAFIRFLANGLLAVLFGVAIASLLPGLSFPAQILVSGLLAGMFAVCRDLVQRFLTRAIFLQPDFERTAQELQAMRSNCSDEEQYLQRSFERIADLMKASCVRISDRPVSPQHFMLPCLASQLSDTEALMREGVKVIVPVRLAQDDARYALLGERQGGRPYLSEDLGGLAYLTAQVTEQVGQIREAEVQRLVSQAELRALQAQIHPHFLFNALNTLYGVIPREASGARRLLLNLADVFRYFLQTERTFVPLEEEIRIVRAYVAIEEARLGQKLKAEIVLDETALREPIPVLSIQPLVENAIKHGVASVPEGGAVRLEIRRDGDTIRVSVSDTGPGFGHSTRARVKDGAGVGLENVSRRLSLCYGPEAQIRVESGAGGTTVSFTAPCEKSAAVTV